MSEDYSYHGTLRPWLKEIFSLHEAGKTPTEIGEHIWPEVKRRYQNNAAYFYPSQSAIKYILRRYGLLKESNYLEKMADANAKKRKIWRLHRGGLTAQTLSEQFGVSRARIYMLIKEGERLVAWDKARKKREEILDSLYSLEERYNLEVKQTTNKGRPIDMGGPRDVWIDCELWEIKMD